MGARPDTWMPLFWGDYARDTGNLNATEHGAYLMLIKHYWCTGEPLNDDDNELWRIACCDSKKAWLKVRKKLDRFFTKNNGLLRHARVDNELESAIQRSKKKAEAGAKGAAKRWQKNSTGIAEPLKSDSSAIAEPSGCHWQNDAQSQPQSQPQSHNKINHHQDVRSCDPPSDGPGGGILVAAGDPRVKEVCSRFWNLRDELWPNDPSPGGPRQTDQALAIELVQTGCPVDEITKLVEIQMRAHNAKNLSFPNTLMAFKLSLRDRVQRVLSGYCQPTDGGPSMMQQLKEMAKEMDEQEAHQ